VYYKARKIAMNNGQDYHLASVLKRGKRIIRIGTNSNKTHPRFLRIFDSGPKMVYTLHAEMDTLRFAKPGDTLIVLRFKSDGTLSMACPCDACKKHIKDAGIAEVFYSNRDGEIVYMQKD